MDQSHAAPEPLPGGPNNERGRRPRLTPDLPPPGVPFVFCMIIVAEVAPGPSRPTARDQHKAALPHYYPLTNLFSPARTTG